jgi:hypothetical protein
MKMRLAVSFVGKKESYFLDLRIKSYGCLKFQGEVWARRACVGANQQELTTCAKSGGQEEKEFLEVWKMGQGFWENGCTAPPFFEACPYTWKC